MEEEDHIEEGKEYRPGGSEEKEAGAISDTD